MFSSTHAMSDGSQTYARVTQAHAERSTVQVKVTRTAANGIHKNEPRTGGTGRSAKSSHGS